MTYDEIGNPITFGSKSFEWCGRQLERITDGDNTYVYAYNTDGDRVSKTVNGVKTEYFYNGSILAGQKTGDETLIFMYDNNGDAFGFIYNGEEYYYIKNVQNDIVAIADKNGTVVANYYYDAWGNVTQITGDTALAQTNPLRYRSYYYDSETGYYHLKSRYYSPEVGRFLNADGYAQTGQGLLDKNIFAYCGNNPVNRRDNNGNAWEDVKKWFSKRWNAFKNFVGNTFGNEKTSVFVEDSTPAVDISNLIPASMTVGNRTSTQKKPFSKSKPIMTYGKVRDDFIFASSCGVKINFKNQYYDLSLGVDNIGFSKSTYFSDNSYSSKGIKMDLSRMQVGIEASTTVISWSADNQIENTDYIYCNISMIWPIVAVGTLVGITNVPEYSGYPQLQPQPNN